eukprot:GGOE01003674.1.p1 GENE.GGOE01003674.1~~GGOE01003674.1.p1  ORF type:complete len:454 (-),score=99.62 GGOE01003674.1:216-1403(-)
MQEICEASFGYEDRRLITRALWKRITTSQSKEWPHIYKSLAVFEYLLLHGPESIADEVREQLYNLKTLHDFHFVDEKGVDKGLAIREKSRRLVEWTTDANVLKEERAKTAALQSKYVGISNVSGFTERTSNPPRPSYSNASSTTRSSGNQGRFNDVDALQADEEYVSQQKQILESFQTRRSSNDSNPRTPTNLPAKEAAPAAKPVPKATPKPKPKAPAPAAPVAPVVAAAKPAPSNFDPFGAATPKPKPSTDLNDFFDVAPSPNVDFDPFAAPPPPPPAPAPAPVFSAPPPSDDLFGAPDAAFGAPNDLFSNANPFFGDSSPSAEQPQGSSEKKSTFQDATFDSLCSLDNLSGKPQAQAEPEKRGAPQSLKSLKAQQQQKAMSSAPVGDTYNPFL